MRIYSYIMLVVLVLIAPSILFSAEQPQYVNTNFLIQTYEDGKKQLTKLVHLEMTDNNNVQWTNIYVTPSLCIDNISNLSVTRWDEGISNVTYDKDSFQLTMTIGPEQTLVRGTRIPNEVNKYRVIGIGFRRDHLTGKTVKIEWKSID